MDVRTSLAEWAMVSLMPIASIGALWLKRRWHVGALVICAALMSWGLLLYWESLEDAAAIETFDRLQHPTEAQILAFSADGASKAFSFLFGLPMFLLYGLAWLVVVRVVRAVARRWVHA